VAASVANSILARMIDAANGATYGYN